MASSFDETSSGGEGDVPEYSSDELGGSEDEVTAFHDFIAGGVAGSASVVVGHPFDTIKVGWHHTGVFFLLS